MSDYINIAVLAISELQSELPDSLTGSGLTHTEKSAARLAPLAYREVLGLPGIPWPEAIERYVLSSDAKASPAFGPKYQYELPSEILHVWRVDYSDYHWQREGRYVRSDDPGPLCLRAIRFIEPEAASPMLIALAAARLAMRLARPLTDSAADRQAIRGNYEDQKRETVSALMSERAAVHLPQADVLTRAGYLTDRGAPDALDKAQS